MSSGVLTVNQGTNQGILVDQAGTVDIGVVKIDTASAGTYGSLFTGTVGVSSIPNVPGGTINAATISGNLGTIGTIGLATINGNLGTLGTVGLATVQMTSGTLNVATISSLPNLPQGSINVTAGTIASVGTVGTIGLATVAGNLGTLGTVGLATVQMTSGTLNVATISSLPNLPQGSINVTAGTIASVGTIGTVGLATITGNIGTIGTLGLGTVAGALSSVGTIGTIGLATITGNIGTIGTLGLGTVVVSAGTFRNDPRPSKNMIGYGTNIAASGALASTIVGSASVGAGTSLWLNRLSIVNPAGTVLCVLGFGTAQQGTNVFWRGVLGTQTVGGVVVTMPEPENLGMTNQDLVFSTGAAGTVDLSFGYFISA